jgi:hypothetical protein
MTVRRRHVFFLSGFDPKGASYYHALYRAQAALQSRVSGESYEVGPRVRLANGNASWEVRSATTRTVYEYARWDDIVRAHWPRNAGGVLRASLRVVAMLAGAGGALRKTWRAAPRTLIALAMPIAAWGIAVLAAVLAAWTAAMATHSWIVAAAAAAAVLWVAFRIERAWNMAWLLRIYAFAVDWADARVPALPQRLDGIASDVRARLFDPEVDEVIVVGFSVGSLLAASIVSRVLRDDAVPAQKLSLLTLGHCIPLLGLIPRAASFREELSTLADSPRLNWVDYSSPADWGSFALADPLALCLARAPRRAPLMMSPRFHTLFDEPTYLRLRRDKRRMHLQYLMAGERASGYDYFAMTAGPAPLAGANLR